MTKYYPINFKYAHIIHLDTFISKLETGIIIHTELNIWMRPSLHVDAFNLK